MPLVKRQLVLRWSGATGSVSPSASRVTVKLAKKRVDRAFLALHEAFLTAYPGLGGSDLANLDRCAFFVRAPDDPTHSVMVNNPAVDLANGSVVSIDHRPPDDVLAANPSVRRIRRKVPKPKQQQQQQQELTETEEDGDDNDDDDDDDDDDNDGDDNHSPDVPIQVDGRARSGRRRQMAGSGGAGPSANAASANNSDAQAQPKAKLRTKSTRRPSKQKSTADSSAGDNVNPTSDNNIAGDRGVDSTLITRDEATAAAAAAAAAAAVLAGEPDEPRHEHTSSPRHHHLPLHRLSLSGTGGSGDTSNAVDEPASTPRDDIYNDIAEGKQTSLVARFMLPSDRLTVQETVGHGHFATVSRGRYQGKMVAIKMVNVLSAKTQAMFRHEAGLLAMLPPHPHVIRCVGICSQPGDDTWYMVSEFCTMGSLNKYLRQVRASPTDKMRFGADAARGLNHLHAHGVIHRDLSARNLLLTAGRRVKVSDLGLSRFVRARVPPPKIKARPVRWMAPEALRGGNYSFKSDVWALGITLWEIATDGAIPYGRGIKHKDVIEGVCSGRMRLSRPHAATPAMGDVMRACWTTNRDERPSAQECAQCLRQALDETVGHAAAAAGPNPTVGGSWQSQHHRRLPPASGGVLSKLIPSPGRVLRPPPY